MRILSFSAMEAELDRLGGRVPDTAEYQHLGTLVTGHPLVGVLNRLDPFGAEYRTKAMELYFALRGRAAAGYDPARDEASVTAPEADIWSGLTPWSFRDPGFVSEFLFSWGHIMRLLDLPPGGSVLEYGPGSGQLLLMLARMGFAAHGVDIDAPSLAGVARQAAAMGLTVATERAEFGSGFGETRFDRIVFFEAFHHAFDFEALLRRLLERLKPGGRLILCGEPVVPETMPGGPYAWGPRLDGLSLYCIRRFGWMELGFTHEFLMEAFRRGGWTATFHPFPGCARANAYVAVRQGESPVVMPAALDPGLLRRMARRLPAPVRRVLRRLWRLWRPG